MSDYPQGRTPSKTYDREARGSHGPRVASTGRDSCRPLPAGVRRLGCALIAIREGLAIASLPETVSSLAEGDRAIETARSIALVASLGWLFATLGPISTRVGYRVKDVWLMLIPFYGLLYLLPKSAVSET
jgi:hypothetical protein